MIEYNIEETKVEIEPQNKTYRRFAYFSIEDIEKIIINNFGKHNKTKIIINGYHVKIATKRLRRMIININCFENKVPLFFSLEYGINDRTVQNPHLNLYGKNDNGNIILITQNDIRKGGDDERISNSKED